MEESQLGESNRSTTRRNEQKRTFVRTARSPTKTTSSVKLLKGQRVGVRCTHVGLITGFPIPINTLLFAISLTNASLSILPKLVTPSTGEA